jgi:hypothetical protein
LGLGSKLRRELGKGVVKLPARAEQRAGT